MSCDPGRVPQIDPSEPDIERDECQQIQYRDVDEDGIVSLICGGTDCNDQNLAVRPGAEELCDGLDNDCDRRINEGFDLISDSNHCGSCNFVCEENFSDATVCIEGQCWMPCDNGGNCALEQQCVDTTCRTTCESYLDCEVGKICDEHRYCKGVRQQYLKLLQQLLS